jgi:hypothetical protein
MNGRIMDDVCNSLDQFAIVCRSLARTGDLRPGVSECSAQAVSEMSFQKRSGLRPRKPIIDQQSTH